MADVKFKLTKSDSAQSVGMSLDDHGLKFDKATMEVTRPLAARRYVYNLLVKGPVGAKGGLTASVGGGVLFETSYTIEDGDEGYGFKAGHFTIK